MQRYDFFFILQWVVPRAKAVLSRILNKRPLGEIAVIGQQYGIVTLTANNNIFKFRICSTFWKLRS